MLLSQPKIKGIEELPGYTAYFFTEDFPIEAKVRDKIMSKGAPKARLRELADALPGMDFSTDGAIEDALKSLATKHALGFGDYQAVARLAVSGTNVGPSITGMFRVMGRERVTKRIERMLEAMSEA
jgi:glutamyl-tRNA synthetase